MAIGLHTERDYLIPIAWTSINTISKNGMDTRRKWIQTHGIPGILNELTINRSTLYYLRYAFHLPGSSTEYPSPLDVTVGGVTKKIAEARLRNIMVYCLEDYETAQLWDNPPFNTDSLVIQLRRYFVEYEKAGLFTRIRHKTTSIAYNLFKLLA